MNKSIKTIVDIIIKIFGVLKKNFYKYSLSPILNLEKLKNEIIQTIVCSEMFIF